jgi:hypothetical protein
LLQLGLRDDVSSRRWRIDDRQRLYRGTRGLRKPRFQKRHRPLDEAERQPLGGKSADEHQRQLPGDIEQLVIGGWILGGAQEPPVERPIMRQRARYVGDLARDLADLLGHRKQELCAKTVGRERYRGFRLGRRGLRLRRGIGNRAQCLDHLRALLVVGKRIERPLRLIRRQGLGATGGRGSRRTAGLRESRERVQDDGQQDRGEELVRHASLIEK